MNSAIEIKIRQLIIDKLGKDESQITDEASFRDDLEVDSLDFTELIVGIEKEFKIAIPDDVYDRLKTVGALNALVAKLVSPSVATPVKTKTAVEELEEQEA